MLPITCTYKLYVRVRLMLGASQHTLQGSELTLPPPVSLRHQNQRPCWQKQPPHSRRDLDYQTVSPAVVVCWSLSSLGGSEAHTFEK